MQSHFPWRSPLEGSAFMFQIAVRTMEAYRTFRLSSDAVPADDTALHQRPTLPVVSSECFILPLQMCILRMSFGLYDLLLLLAGSYMYTGMFIQAVSLHIPCRQLYLRLLTYIPLVGAFVQWCCYSNLCGVDFIHWCFDIQICCEGGIVYWHVIDMWLCEMMCTIGA